MSHRHDANIARNDSENEAVIRHCSICGKCTVHPWDDRV